MTDRDVRGPVGSLGMGRRFLFGALCLVVLLGGGTEASAFERADDLPVFDIRRDDPQARQIAESSFSGGEAILRQDAILQLQRETPGAVVSLHETLHTPAFIRSTEGFLTKPAYPAEWLGVVETYVAARPGLFGITAELLKTCRISRDYVTEHNGVRHVTLPYSKPSTVST